MTQPWIVYGSELSPFTLKVLALCRYKGLPYRFLPEEGGWLDNVRVSLRKERLARRQLPLTYPPFTADDEFPLVPFLFGPDGENLYDSSAIGEWLDRRSAAPSALIPAQPALEFLVRLLDEFADEWMLYLVHHYRWKVSAADNDAGKRLGHEMRAVTLGLGWPVDRYFSARQVRRLPYLFSVAPQGFSIPGLKSNRQPPSREGFPATYALIEGSYRRILMALEEVFAHQPYLFGEQPTLADFSIYGQIGMNLPDPSANKFIAAVAPLTHRWVRRMHKHDFAAPAAPQLFASPVLKSLLAEVCRVYVPLMQQNLREVERLRAAGQRRFNERAFDRGESLYDGVIDGMPFRHVAKTFQAKTWRQLCERWAALGDAGRAQAQSLLPENPGLDKPAG